jgi:hypothetical protein
MSISWCHARTTASTTILKIVGEMAMPTFYGHNWSACLHQFQWNLFPMEFVCRFCLNMPIPFYEKQCIHPNAPNHLILTINAIYFHYWHRKYIDLSNLIYIRLIYCIQYYSKGKQKWFLPSVFLFSYFINSWLDSWFVFVVLPHLSLQTFFLPFDFILLFILDNNQLSDCFPSRTCSVRAFSSNRKLLLCTIFNCQDGMKWATVAGSRGDSSVTTHAIDASSGRCYYCEGWDASISFI